MPLSAFVALPPKPPPFKVVWGRKASDGPIPTRRCWNRISPLFVLQTPLQLWRYHDACVIIWIILRPSVPGLWLWWIRALLKDFPTKRFPSYLRAVYRCCWCCHRKGSHVHGPSQSCMFLELDYFNIEVQCIVATLIVKKLNHVLQEKFCDQL